MSAQYSQNPYIALGVPYDADDQSIRKSFHEKLQRTSDPEALRDSYEKIKTIEKRSKYRWYCLESMEPPQSSEFSSKQIDPSSLEGLIKELAFLSDWELDLEEE